MTRDDAADDAVSIPCEKRDDTTALSTTGVTLYFKEAFRVRGVTTQLNFR